MEILEKYMPLEPGEEVICHLEGNAYNISSNIILRIAGFIERIVAILIGCPKKAHVIVTNRRVIIIEIQKFLWFFIGSASAKSVMPRSIGSLGYQFARSFIFFKSHYLEFSSGSVLKLVKSKSGKDRVYEMIKSIVNLAEKITTK
jgi:hypothetical protein